MSNKLLVGSLVLFCAVAISAIAAYFSVVGLAALFAASFLSVAVMGVILEGSKLVAAGWLHSNWHNPKVTRAHKSYLCAAVVALMLITSLGIYGYLMKAHLDQKAPATEITLQLEGHQSQLDQLIAQRTELERQQANINKTVDAYLAAGRASGASSFMRQQQQERDRISGQIAQVNQQITAKNTEMAPLRRESNAAEAKLGPLKYIPGIKDPTTAVQVVIAVLMFAFDPLAVVMMISGTITLGEWMRERRRKPEPEPEPVEAWNPPPPPPAVPDQGNVLPEPVREEQAGESEDGLTWPEALKEVGAPDADTFAAAKRSATGSAGTLADIVVKPLPDLEFLPVRTSAVKTAAAPLGPTGISGVFSFDGVTMKGIDGTDPEDFLTVNPAPHAEPAPNPVLPDMELVASPTPNFGGAVDPDYRARLLALETGEPVPEPTLEDDLERIDNKDLLIAILESDPELFNTVIEAVEESKTQTEEEKISLRQWLEPKNPPSAS